MANKAVVGIAALGTTAFLANEKYKESLCRKEEEEERQRRLDLQASFEWRRQQEKERLLRKEHEQGHNSPKQQDDHDEEDSMLDSMNVSSQKYLVVFLKTLRAKAVLRRKRRTASSSFRGMHLPLLKTEENSPDEIVLAAALALGNPQILQILFEERVLKPSPDLALTRLTPDSVDFILTEYEEFIHKGAYDESYIPLLKMNSDFVLRVFRHVFHPDEPYADLVPKEWIQNYGQLAEAKLWGVQLGFILVPDHAFKKENKGHSLAFEYIKHDLTRNPKEARLGDSVHFMNFIGNFSYPVVGVREEEVQHPSGQSFALKTSTVSGPAERTHPFKMLVEEKEEQRKDGIRFVALLTAIRMVTEAMHRLNNLRRSNNNLPAEHIAVSCGMPIEVLQEMRNGYIELVDHNKDRIRQTLATKLERCVPPHKSNLPSPVSSVKAEVAEFVKNYMRLLDLSYCLIPLVDSKPPSEFVCEKGVRDTAMASMLLHQPKTFFRDKRRLELEERNRLVRSREIMQPPPHVTSIVLGALLALFYWVSFSCLQWQLYSRHHLATLEFLHFLSAVLSALGLSQFLYVLDPLLSSNKTNYNSFCGGIWSSSSNMVECIIRWINVKVRHETPFHQEVNRLTEICLLQYKQWAARCVRQDFYDSLQRKRITSQSLSGMLMNCLDEDEDEDGFMMGHFPGSLAEAETFLDLNIVDDDDNNNEESESDLEKNGRARLLTDLTREVENCMEEFSSGTRVQVVFELPTPFMMPPATDEKPLIAAVTRHGSVVSSYTGFVLVHIDGETRPIPVPSKHCQAINEANAESPGASCPRTKKNAFKYGTKVRAKLMSMGSSGDSGQRQLVDSHLVVGEVIGGYDDNVLIRGEGRDDPITVPKDCCEVIDEFDGASGGHNETSYLDDVPLSSSEDEEKGERSETPNFKRSYTVREALEVGGWVLERRKKHLIYKRRRCSEDGEECGVETFTLASTPSDYRAEKKALSHLNRLNKEYAASSAPEPGNRKCAACRKRTPFSDFSKSQWKKGGVAQCKLCVQRNSD